MYVHSKINYPFIKRKRWAGHVTRMGIAETYTGFWWGNLRERDHLKDAGVDGKLLLRWIFRKWGPGLDRAGSG
jgi:hypothetical protein